MNQSPVKLEIYLSLYESLPDFFLVNAPWSYLGLGLVLFMLCVVIGIAFLCLKDSPHLSVKTDRQEHPISTSKPLLAYLKVAVLLCLSPLAVLGVLMPPALALKSVNDGFVSVQAPVLLPYCAIKESQGTHLKFTVSSLGGESLNTASKVWLSPHTREVLEGVRNDQSSVIELLYSKGSLGLWSLKKIRYISMWECMQQEDCSIEQYKDAAVTQCAHPFD